MSQRSTCLILAVVLAACGAPAARGPASDVNGGQSGAVRAPVAALGPEPTEASYAMVPAIQRAATTSPAPARGTDAATVQPDARGPYPGPPTATSTRVETAPPGATTARPPTGTPSGQQAATGGGGRSPTGRPEPSRTAKPREPTATREPTEDRRLVTLLRRGGLIIYQRHTRTDWSQNDRELAWVAELLADPESDDLFDDCDRQRLLSDDGRAEARAIGEAVRGLGIPIGDVITSPWCRTRETAELAFGGGDVAKGRLFDSGYLARGSDERKAYRDRLRDLLSDGPGEGTNRVIVGHMPQLQDAAGITLEEGEAAIIQPGDGGFKVIGRVRADGWSSLGN